MVMTADSQQVTVAQAWNSLPTNVTASTSLPSFNLKHFYLPNLSHHFKLLSHICVPCPRSYLAYATLISTFYYYYYYYYC